MSTGRADIGREKFLKGICVISEFDLTRTGFDRLYRFLKFMGERNPREIIEDASRDLGLMAKMARSEPFLSPTADDVMELDALARETGKQRVLERFWGMIKRIHDSDLSDPGLTPAETIFARELQNHVRTDMAAGNYRSIPDDAPPGSKWAEAVKATGGEIAKQ